MSDYTTTEIREWVLSSGLVDPSTAGVLDAQGLYDAAVSHRVNDFELDAAFPEWGGPGTVAGAVASMGLQPLRFGRIATAPVATPAVAVSVINPAPVPIVPRTVQTVQPMRTDLVDVTINAPAPAPSQPTTTLPTPYIAPAVEPYPTPQPQPGLSPVALGVAGLLALLALRR